MAQKKTAELSSSGSLDTKKSKGRTAQHVSRWFECGGDESVCFTYGVGPGEARWAEKAGRMGSCGGLISAYSTRENAGIAQLVEQLICNQQVVGSNPTAGSLIG